MTDLQSLLNPEQFEAATAPDGPLLILAAAGTGKTRTLVYRVAHLVERGVRPWNILLLTLRGGRIPVPYITSRLQ